MTILILFIALVFLSVVLIVALANADDLEEAVSFVVISFAMGAISTICILKSIQPTAIDVYRGETTLKITYVDSIPTDTIVIFKDK